jgi:PAS domain S-box-containing protein
MTSNASISQGNLMPASGRGNSLELALEVSELRYRRLFETAQDGILILDANTGKIIDVNPFLLDLLDYPFESMIGLRLWEIGQFKDIAANQAAFEALQTNEYIRYENLPLRTKTGKEIQVEFVSNVYFVGSDKVIQCNIRDISARAEFQAASKSHADALELAVRARDEVIVVLSHELRNPLAAISSMIDVLELGHGEVGMPDKKDLPPQFDKSALAFIRRNVQSLVHLVTELLDFTHIANEALGLEFVKVDAHEVIRFVLKNLESQQKAVGIGIDLRLEAPRSYIRADSDRLEQVLSNLIGNALKFTPKGGKISIVTRNEESGGLVIEVSDTGIGIPADALPRIFSPFEQGDSSIHRRYGGLGLGLSIANTLIKAHGGALEVESEGSGRGAKFTARFKVGDSLSYLTAQDSLQLRQPCGAKIAVMRPPTRQTPNCNPTELTMTQNSALDALQHGATSDAFEIMARSKSLPIHECKDNENNK